jgi:intracellular multiplication protein IcmD
MMSQSLRRILWLTGGAIFCLCFGIDVFAASSISYASGQGIGAVAGAVKGNLKNIASLITAGAYVAGMGFAVGAIVKFKAHKDNPTQVAISVPIAMLFIGAALLFAPSVFKTTGATLFGASGTQATISGVQSF